MKSILTANRSGSDSNVDVGDLVRLQVVKVVEKKAKELRLKMVVSFVTLLLIAVN